MINKIGKITIYVDNQEEAIAFWRDKVGFSVTEMPMGPSMKWVEARPSESEFTSFVIYDRALMKSHNPSANTDHPSVLLSTKDIEASHSKMKEKGIEVEDIMDMPYGKMYSFKDNEGNSYLLREDK